MEGTRRETHPFFVHDPNFALCLLVRAAMNREECDRTQVAAFKATIHEHLYKLGPTWRLAYACDAFDPTVGLPRVEFLVALAEILDAMEARHESN
jgi:hypothetical protein